jgi:hypothetical protein
MNFREAKATYFLRRNWKTSWKHMLWCGIRIIFKSVISIRIKVKWHFKNIAIQEITDMVNLSFNESLTRAKERLG